MRDARLAVVGQTPEDGTADPAKVGTERESFKDICSLTYAAVDVDWSESKKTLFSLRDS